MRIALILFIFFANIPLFASIIPYISPGIRIGWNIKGKVTLEPKVSFGVYGVAKKDVFLDITLGHNVSLGPKRVEPYQKYTYLDLKMGKLADWFGNEKNQYMYGGGLGVVSSSGSLKPRATLFCGWLVFLTTDFIFIHWDEIHADFGIQGVLPIPLRKFDFGDIGGSD